jgi:hypothetical protein
VIIGKKLLNPVWDAAYAPFSAQHVFVSTLLMKFKEMSAFATGTPVCLEFIHKKHPVIILAPRELKGHANA